MATRQKVNLPHCIHGTDGTNQMPWVRRSAPAISSCRYGSVVIGRGFNFLTFELSRVGDLTIARGTDLHGEIYATAIFRYNCGAHH